MVGVNWKSIINRLRDEQKLTQEKFAEKCGVSRTTVQNWEKDKTAPHLKTCETIIAEFRLTEEEYPELFAYVASCKREQAALQKTPFDDAAEETADGPEFITEGAIAVATADGEETEIAIEAATVTLIYNQFFLPAEAYKEAKAEPTDKQAEKPKESAVARLHKKWKALHPLCKAIISAFCVWFTVWFVIALILIGVCVFPAQTDTPGELLAQATFVSIDWDELIFLLIVSLFAVTVLSVIIYLIIRQIRRIRER